VNQPPRLVLLDVEGTTTPVDFVVETLFGLALERLGSYLGSHGDDAEVRAHVAGLRAAWEAEDPASGRPPWDGPADDPAAATAYASWLTRHDRKVTPLKALQGLIWADAYRSGHLVAPVYDDVAPALERWARRGTPASIFSSGSVLAQRMLFEHTSSGDLTGLLSGFFDTTIGPKREATSYAAIATGLEVAPADVLFVSDTVAELDAARDAGMQTALCVRAGAAETPSAGSHRVIESFAQLG
jgi:enolase-phosphatase E1